MFEFKVKLKYHENDSYNELWQVVGEQKYFARHTYNGGIWYFVTDPLGYCELDYPCPDDYIFIVCDQKGNELFKSTNADDSCNFPCLRELRRREWNKLKNSLQIYEENSELNFYIHAFTGHTGSTLDKWLLTFKDPEIYGDKAKDYDENWVWWTKEIDEEIIGSFEYVGTTYYITKVRKKHEICGVEWFEYYSADEFMGAWYDKNIVGAMYPESEAIKKVVETLKEIYPGCEYGISAINIYKIGDSQFEYEKRMKLADAARNLLNGNYNRKFVDSVIENEKKNPSFYKNIYEIRKIYPECQADYSYSI